MEEGIHEFSIAIIVEVNFAESIRTISRFWPLLILLNRSLIIVFDVLIREQFLLYAQLLMLPLGICLLEFALPFFQIFEVKCWRSETIAFF